MRDSIINDRESVNIKTMDIEQARFNMVEQQIRTWEVLDQEVLDLLFTVRREEFVPPAYRSLAFADLELPLPGGERMWAPKVEARVLQALKLKPDANRCSRSAPAAATSPRCSRAARGDVTTVEIDPQLARFGARAAGAARLLRCALRGRRRRARLGHRRQYDAIVLTGSTPLLPEAFFAQLRPGGRVFAIVGEAPAMTARLVAWTAPGARVTTDLFETVVAPLKNAAAPARFKF